MKFFIDSADVKDIRTANDMGVIDGVTTNPSLLARVGRGLEETIQEICSIVDGPISAEVVSLTGPEMIAEGSKLAKIHSNVVVKIPMGTEGMKAGILDALRKSRPVKAAEPGSGEVYAIVVGVGHYQMEKIRVLPNAGNDAKMFYNYLSGF